MAAYGGCNVVVSGYQTINLAAPASLVPCTTTFATPGVWYNLTGDGNLHRFSSCNVASATYDAKIGLFSSCPADTGCGLLVGFADTTNFGVTGASLCATLSFKPVSGTSYFLYVQNAPQLDVVTDVNHCHAAEPLSFKPTHQTLPRVIALQRNQLQQTYCNIKTGIATAGRWFTFKCATTGAVFTITASAGVTLEAYNNCDDPWNGSCSSTRLGTAASPNPLSIIGTAGNTYYVFAYSSDTVTFTLDYYQH
eukprot:TRINITY_DN6023_c0_g1_i1.p1 TRINITY_DN6023_c0_g1~~TRINITY_DN6023_c0_g1_i1.p1  ORF type:complete len:288 (-),score=53.49 TRINITY_DN6023_c0_g1_i1:97-849(-)